MGLGFYNTELWTVLLKNNIKINSKLRSKTSYLPTIIYRKFWVFKLELTHTECITFNLKKNY